MDEKWQQDPADVYFSFLTYFDGFVLVISLLS